MNNSKYILLFAVLLFSSSVVHAREMVTIVAEDAWFPYSGVTDSNVYQSNGIAVDLVREAFNKVDVDVRFLTLPYDDGVKLVEEGIQVAVFDVPYESDAEERFLWPEQALMNVYAHVFVTNDSKLKAISSIEELNGLQVGLVRGYGYGDEIDGNLKMLKVFSSTPQINLLRLMQGEVQVAVIFDQVARYLTTTMQLKDKVHSIGETENLDIFIAFSKKHRDSEKYLKLFNSGFRQIKEDGTYDRIMTRWNNVPGK